MTSHEETMRAIDEFNRKVNEATSRQRAASTLKRKAGMKHSAFTRPTPSDALAVHPKQVAEAMKFAKDRGVPTDYTPDGSPLIQSVAHQKRLAKIHGFRPKRGY